MLNSSIWPIDRTLSGAITPGQSKPGSDGNEGEHHISQSSRVGASSSNYLVSYPGHSLGRVGVLPSAEMQSVYSIGLADRTIYIYCILYIYICKNTGGLCCSGTNGSLTFDFGSLTQGERYNSYYADHTIWPHKRAVHLAMFKISVGRDLQNSNYVPQR